VIGDADCHFATRCNKCFSLLYWTGYEGTIRVPYGSLIDEPALKPTAHMFVGSKASWYEILDQLPQHDEYPWSRTHAEARERPAFRTVRKAEEGEP
jgi:hypothetical protein